jgi:hypothetical protein
MPRYDLDLNIEIILREHNTRRLPNSDLSDAKRVAKWGTGIYNSFIRIVEVAGSPDTAIMTLDGKLRGADAEQLRHLRFNHVRKITRELMRSRAGWNRFVQSKDQPCEALSENEVLPMAVRLFAALRHDRDSYRCFGRGFAEFIDRLFEAGLVDHAIDSAFPIRFCYSKHCGLRELTNESIQKLLCHGQRFHDWQLVNALMDHDARIAIIAAEKYCAGAAEALLDWLDPSVSGALTGEQRTRMEELIRLIDERRRPP